jgi:hypothetical protein
VPAVERNGLEREVEATLGARRDAFVLAVAMTLLPRAPRATIERQQKRTDHRVSGTIF